MKEKSALFLLVILLRWSLARAAALSGVRSLQTQSLQTQSLHHSRMESTAIFSDDIPAEVYRTRAQSGVNLGNWFVAEKRQIVSADERLKSAHPSYFACATNDSAEFNVAQGCDQSWIENHWDTWITEDTFIRLAQMGINTVRLPIGYWSVGPDHCNCLDTSPFAPYMHKYVGSWPRVKQAIALAGSYGIGVLVDLHGVEGSQNGGYHNHQPQFIENSTYQEHTTKVLEFIASEIKDMPNVVGLEILNEPFPCPMDRYSVWYADTISRLQEILGQDFPFYIFVDSDDISSWVKQYPGFLVSDVHQYFLWDATYQNMPTDNITQAISTRVRSQFQRWSPNIVIGEWSCALADGTPSAPPDFASWSRYCDAQMKLYSDTSLVAGWHAWNVLSKGSTCSPWDFITAAGQNEEGQDCWKDFGRPLYVPANDRGSFDSSSTAGPFDQARSVSTAKEKRDVDRPISLNASEVYDHGCSVAKHFARHGSRLGFVSQYMKQYASSDISYYTEHLEHFVRGVAECESHS